MLPKKLFIVTFVTNEIEEVYAENKILASKLARIEQKKKGGCQVIVHVKNSEGKIL